MKILLKNQLKDLSDIQRHIRAQYKIYMAAGETLTSSPQSNVCACVYPRGPTIPEGSEPPPLQCVSCTPLKEVKMYPWSLASSSTPFTALSASQCFLRSPVNQINDEQPIFKNLVHIAYDKLVM